MINVYKNEKWLKLFIGGIGANLTRISDRFFDRLDYDHVAGFWWKRFRISLGKRNSHEIFMYLNEDDWIIKSIFQYDGKRKINEVSNNLQLNFLKNVLLNDYQVYELLYDEWMLIQKIGRIPKEINITSIDLVPYLIGDRVRYINFVLSDFPLTFQASYVIDKGKLFRLEVLRYNASNLDISHLITESMQNKLLRHPGIRLKVITNA